MAERGGAAERGRSATYHLWSFAEPLRFSGGQLAASPVPGPC